MLALVGSLILNFTLLTKLNQLEEQVHYISATSQDFSHRIDNQASQVYDALEEFKNEQSWISSVTMDIDKTNFNNGQAKAIFNWQIKEWQHGSNVLFHYSFGDRKEYFTLTAEEVEKGFFQVKVPFEFDKEPQWHVGLITSEAYHSEEVTEKELDSEDENSINYYITVSDGDYVKSSEIQQEFLDKFRTSFYGILQTDVHQFKSKLDITLIHYQIGENSANIEKAYLLKYEQDTLIGEEEMQTSDENSAEYGERFFQLNQVDPYDEMRLILKVVYNTGETFEKEIY
ncbi:hypothetical protein [Bacillus nitroreducens]